MYGFKKKIKDRFTRIKHILSDFGNNCMTKGRVLKDLLFSSKSFVTLFFYTNIKEDGKQYIETSFTIYLNGKENPSEIMHAIRQISDNYMSRVIENVEENAGQEDVLKKFKDLLNNN